MTERKRTEVESVLRDCRPRRWPAMTAEKMMELADEIEAQRGKDLYLIQCDRDLIVAALRSSAVGAGAREALERDKLWHIIAREIACEKDCQKWPNGCGCAQNAADAVLALQSEPVQPADDWKDDPSADERWNTGVDFVMKLLCDYLGVDPNAVTWDAATETVDGDVSAVIGNILRSKFGEDWGPNDAHPVQPAGKGEITDEVVERAWAAIVGKDIAKDCYQASIVRADLRTALEAALPSDPVRRTTQQGGDK